MNDTAAANKQPPYWGKCEEMNFDQLCEFIANSLKRALGAGTRTEFPHSKGEFLSLWEMLREKYDAQVKPSEPDKLTRKRARLTKLIARVEELHNTPFKKYRKKGREIRDAEPKIKKLVEEIRELEERSDALPGYVPYTLQGDPRYRALCEMRGAIYNAFDSIENVPTTRLGWRFAEAADAEGRLPGLKETLQSQARSVGFDQERLDNAMSLGPKRRYEWIEGYDGYSVFEFPNTQKKLMECFMRGNALFVIEPELGDDWQEMNKQELRTHPLVTRILHRGNWAESARQHLGLS